MLDNLNRVSFHARTTTGQGLSIRYDAVANAMVIFEQDWFAGSFRSSAVPPKSGKLFLAHGRCTPLTPKKTE
jgi:hypothetical protein